MQYFMSNQSVRNTQKFYYSNRTKCAHTYLASYFTIDPNRRTFSMLLFVRRAREQRIHKVIVCNVECRR